jgi:protoporphyrinogen oxidase
MPIEKTMVEMAKPAATTEPSRTAIVGGGMLGLALALACAQRGERVTVFEAAPEFGGLASAWQLGEVTWDRHYHVILYSDTRLRALLAEIGLEPQTVWSTTGTGFYSGGKFYPMNGALDFFRFPPLGLIDKLRLGATIAFASRIANPRALEKISVETWLTRYSGKTTFEKIWRPLLRAKLGQRYRETSASFIWAIIVRLYAARRAGLGAERFGYVRGGYAKILGAIVAQLRERGVMLHVDCAVTNIARDGEELVVTTAASAERFDRVVVTSPAPYAASIVPGLSDDERARLTSKIYGGIVCASLLLDKPLGPYYVTNLTDEWVPFSAVIDAANIMSPEEFGGRAIVYLPKYVAPDDPLFEQSDAAIEETFVRALERMYPHFKRADVRAFRISRVRRVFPIATLGYSDTIPPIATSIPGLYLLNSAHIVNGTLNVNETLQLVERGLAAMNTQQGRALAAASEGRALAAASE